MNKNFSSFIAELRKEQNLTQKELADRIGVSDKAVSRWENGKNYPDIEIMQSLGEIFHVSVSELLQGERLEQKAVIFISEQNVVKNIKKNKMLKIVIAIIVALAVIVSGVLGAVAVINAKNPLIENHIYLPSKDIRSQLDNIQAFIDPMEARDFNITWLKVFLNTDKEVSDLYVEGVTGDNVYYHCGCSGFDDTDTFIYQHKEPREWTAGFNCNKLIEFLDVLDFSKIDKNYSIANEYIIDFYLRDGYSFYDEEAFVNNTDKLCFMYDLKTKKFKPISAGDILTGEYISVDICSAYEGTGTLLAQILVEAY
ncbi:MAG: helix-turn-helix transcriptional regulator [Clostridiales bacterium]|nr:helix-turn-helix transcriptional regulator [Clostridiales bacterium]